MKLEQLILAICLISLILLPGSTARKFSSRTLEKKILDEILNVTIYDSRIRPNSSPNSTTSKGETEVEVNLMLRSVSKIDDFLMEYSVQLTMREEWYDDRLAYKTNPRLANYFNSEDFPPSLTIIDTSRVWSPDLFILNEKESRLHNLLKPNEYIRIFQNGKVLFSIRLSLTLGCPMDLHLFPMDRQECSIIMASYGRTMDDLVFNWKSEEPVQVPDLALPRFRLEEEETRTLSFSRVTNTGNYSTLEVVFVLRRNFSYYMTQLYIPSIMLVIVSQISFFIDENAAPARTALGITTLLTMTTHIASINSRLPPVSYTKVIDIWNGACLAFVFMALLEYAFVNYCIRYDKRIKKEWEIEHGCAPPTGSGWLSKKTRSKRIDSVSRIVFPIFFLLFNIVYWVYCQTAELTDFY